MTSGDAHSLVLRLAAPMQSWGEHSQYDRRDTASEPTKGGITGLLAAADGRRRGEPIEDLVSLRLGVRTDRAGTLLRDYHTVSDYRGVPLRSASVDGRGVQKRTTYPTHVTQRFYLQDAVFVAAVSGPMTLLVGLRESLRRPAFPLALGRRACVPTQPIVLDAEAHGAGDACRLWLGPPDAVLQVVPWQAGPEPTGGAKRESSPIDLPITVDDAEGDDTRPDVPTSFDLRTRRFRTRRVRQGWVRIPNASSPAGSTHHDPFALLGW